MIHKIYMMLHAYDCEGKTPMLISADAIRAIIKVGEHAVIWMDGGIKQMVYESYEEIVKMLKSLEEQNNETDN